MERDAEPLRDQLAAGVDEPGRVVEGVADRRRIGGPGDDQRHLVGHRAQRVADDLEGRRIVRGRRAWRRSAVGHATCSMTMRVLVVEPRRPAGRDDRRRVELLDERRADDRRSQVAAADDRHAEPAEPSGPSQTDRDDGRTRRRPRSPATSDPRRGSAARHADVDELDLVGLGCVAVRLAGARRGTRRASRSTRRARRDRVRSTGIVRS